MSNNIQIEIKGERSGEKWLKKQGYIILHKNWKYGRIGIDVIGERKSKLHIIEIKTRTDNHLGYPQERITKQKIQKIANAAQKYLNENPQYNEFILDILLIKLNTKRGNDYFLIEDIKP